MLKPTMLLICALLAFAAVAEKKPDKVLLGSTPQYLHIKKNGNISFVETKKKASPFLITSAAEALESEVISEDGKPIKVMRAGVSTKVFSYGGKYLGADLKLHPDPASKKDVWLAPVHYRYFNQFHPESTPDVNFVLLTEDAGNSRVFLTKKSYLKVVDGGKVVWTGRQAEASAFTSEGAATSQTPQGVILRRFSYHGKYLSSDLTLRAKSEGVWTAPLSPGYLNHYHSGPQNNPTHLITEKVEATSAE
ncbi:MAG: hypothetical protein M1549_02150 [Candidatus Dependentiae bacterium]|nr:hypothetical protein [Candidatus Dependentiae bacterium]